MLSFSKLALLVLPLFGAVFADDTAASSAKDVADANTVYSNAHEAFQDLLNALPEESLQAALSSLKGFKDGVFESHHRGVEQVHDRNPALATKLIVAAVQDLKKRQTPSNGTIVAPPPQSSAQQPAESNAQQPTTATVTTTTDRAVIVNVAQTTTDARGQTVVQTTSVLSQVTASVAVTIVRTNTQGQTVTATEQRPAVIRTMTDQQGRTTVTTSAAQFAPTAGEVRTETDAGGSTFLTTYTPGGGKISSIKLITTTGADGKPSTITSYTFVDPAAATTNGGAKASATTTGKPGLQTGAAAKQHGGAMGYALAGAGALALFV
jgi:hypothetical protein